MKKLLFLFLIASSLIAHDTSECTEVTSDETSSQISYDEYIYFMNRIGKLTKKMLSLQKEKFALQETVHHLRQKLLCSKPMRYCGNYDEHIDSTNRICEPDVNNIGKLTQKIFLLQKEKFLLQERMDQLRQKLYPRKHIVWSKMLGAHKRHLHIAKGL